MKAYVVGTCDTKGEELAFVRELLEARGLSTVLVDVGTRSDALADVTAREVAACHPDGLDAVLGEDDPEAALAAMAQAFEHFASELEDVEGMIGLGGAQGTALVTGGMRTLPVGTPKVMVSSVASGNVAPYVGPSDIAMLPSVVDLAGLDRVSRAVLGNAAHALAGMMLARGEIPAARVRPTLAMTAFGVTDPCVKRVASRLEERFDCLVFQATGPGGRSMEKLVESGLVEGVLDVTLSEVSDLLLGGVIDAREQRLDVVAETRVPWVGSVGALDMVVFGPRETVPQRYAARNLYVQDPQVTLMRTMPGENAAMGKWIADKLNRCEGPVRLLLPEGGLSALDATDQPFHDPLSDAALFDALEEHLDQTEERCLERLPHHVNDPQFADALVHSLLEVLGED